MGNSMYVGGIGMHTDGLAVCVSLGIYHGIPNFEIVFIAGPRVGKGIRSHPEPKYDPMLGTQTKRIVLSLEDVPFELTGDELDIREVRYGERDIECNAWFYDEGCGCTSTSTSTRNSIESSGWYAIVEDDEKEISFHGGDVICCLVCAYRFTYDPEVS